MHRNTMNNMEQRGVSAGVVVGAALTLACGLFLSGCSNPAVHSFSATLIGANEVPPVDTAATGTASMTLDTGAGIAVLTISYSGLSGPVVSAHLHGGAAGTVGAIVEDLSDEFVGDDDGFIQTAVSLSAAEIDQLRAGGIYVNLHTAANMDGEIRGPFEPQP